MKTIVALVLVGMAATLALADDCSPMGHSCTTAQDCCGTHTGSRYELTCMGGRCSHWLMSAFLPTPPKKSDDCVPTYHRGCETVSDCCDHHMMCLHTAGQNGGMCRPWLMAAEKEDECVPTGHHGCQSASDCCDHHMMCLHFGGQNSGMCRPWLMADKDVGCSNMFGHCETSQDCCGSHSGNRNDLICVSNRCSHYLMAPATTKEVGCSNYFQPCQTSEDCCGTHNGNRRELVCRNGRCNHWL